MAHTTTRGPRATGSAGRSMTAAARAAAKRAERIGRDTEAPGPADGTLDEGPRRQAGGGTGRTPVVEARGGWDDPPEPVPADREEDGSRGAGRDGRRPGMLGAALTVVLVAALVAAAVLGWQYRDGQRADRARAAALAAAVEAAPVVLSYDYRHLDRDFAAARTHLTGAFRDQYRKTTDRVVGPTAAKYRGVVRARVVKPAGGGAPAASVVSASPDRVVVLLFVDQVTESTRVSGSRVDQNRVRMTLTRTSEGWKVSAVDAL
ncbi:hypothetical protein ACWCP6_14720 [Streptomyces sp. NPDC002004]